MCNKTIWWIALDIQDIYTVSKYPHILFIIWKWKCLLTDRDIGSPSPWAIEFHISVVGELIDIPCSLIKQSWKNTVLTTFFLPKQLPFVSSWVKNSDKLSYRTRCKSVSWTLGKINDDRSSFITTGVGWDPSRDALFLN